MKRKVLLIVGGSDLAGCEMDGSMDSKWNRHNSFAAKLAHNKRVLDGYEIVNAATSGQGNSAIVRTTLMWFRDHYDPETMDVFVVCGWTEPSRMDAPYKTGQIPYHEMYPGADYTPRENFDYLVINAGWTHGHEDQRVLSDSYVEFLLLNPEFLELMSMNYVLQLQWFFKAHGVPYVMMNTLHMFSHDNYFLEAYYPMLDEARYFNYRDNTKSFYTKYQLEGYVNEKAEWYHHGEEPHQLYSVLLEEHIIANNLLDTP